MPVDATELRRRLDDLRAVRAGGVRSTRHQNGNEEREVRFADDRELASAIADLESQIAGAEGRRPPSVIRFSTSKGFDT
ncbi:hypothetical protein [Methylopila sp. M107]|uniref:phage head-tail joining protein n=1 Tax=Methylopila sp. M107 TaxID=1101190 RepID=UPI00035D0239|nr:hypothetical protein [Methylopila sp. M107]